MFYISKEIPLKIEFSSPTPRPWERKQPTFPDSPRWLGAHCHCTRRPVVTPSPGPFPTCHRTWGSVERRRKPLHLGRGERPRHRRRGQGPPRPPAASSSPESPVGPGASAEAAAGLARQGGAGRGGKQLHENPLGQSSQWKMGHRVTTVSHSRRGQHSHPHGPRPGESPVERRHF